MFDDLRIKLRPAASLQAPQGFLNWQSLTIATVGDHGVKGVHHANDTRPQRNLLPFQSGGIALAVNPFVMMQNKEADASKPGIIRKALHPYSGCLLMIRRSSGVRAPGL
jgi:hypothetical protein